MKQSVLLSVPKIKNTPGGTFDVGSNTYSLRVEGEFKDPREMADIVVGTHNGASVYLR